MSRGAGGRLVSCEGFGPLPSVSIVIFLIYILLGGGEGEVYVSGGLFNANFKYCLVKVIIFFLCWMVQNCVASVCA